MNIHNYLLILCLFAVSVQAQPTRFGRVQPTQHALVIGIDQYQHPDIMTLKGAVNDAKLLRDALRQAKVKLPNDRILLNKKATRNAFLQAWRNMLKQAQPGDTLILTFAGHGGQEPDKAPVDFGIFNQSVLPSDPKAMKANTIATSPCSNAIKLSPKIRPARYPKHGTL